MLSIIVAKAKNNIIGKSNEIIWNIPDDMKRFKTLTTGHTVIMGRKTFESIGKPLENRINVILTRNEDFYVEGNNVRIAHSIDDLKEYINSDENVFVIGGATVFSELMPYVKVLYVTEIDKDFEGDTLFNKIDENEWREISREPGPKCESVDFNYDYVVYKRVEK